MLSQKLNPGMNQVKLAVNLGQQYVHLAKTEVVGIWKELGVLASETSIELSNGVGVGDNANDEDGVDKGSGGSEGEGEGAKG